MLVYCVRFPVTPSIPVLPRIYDVLPRNMMYASMRVLPFMCCLAYTMLVYCVHFHVTPSTPVLQRIYDVLLRIYDVCKYVVVLPIMC